MSDWRDCMTCRLTGVARWDDETDDDWRDRLDRWNANREREHAIHDLYDEQRQRERDASSA